MNNPNELTKIDLKYYSMYKSLLSSKRFNELNDVQRALSYFCDLLIGIEESLLSSTNVFYGLVQENVYKARINSEYSSLLEKYRISNPLNDDKFLFRLIATNKPEKNEYILNDIMKHIQDVSEAVTDNEAFYSSILAIKKEDNQTQVFLSYAHDDKLYTAAMFEVFLRHGVYLFIDWMHNGIIPEIDKLKTTLDDALINSDQFLFLRSINSELVIRGSGNLKQWCAWEIGNYYCKKKDQKFYTNIYSYEAKELSSILQNMKPLYGIAKGRLV